MYNPEFELNAPKVTEVRKTQLGLQCDLSYKGNQYSILAGSASGDFVITSGSTTRGLIKFEELPESVQRFVAKKFEELEQTHE